MAVKKDSKKEKKVKPSSKKYTLYEISGDKVSRKSQFCPKCGVGTFLAQHKNRASCGKCGYTEFKTKE